MTINAQIAVMILIGGISGGYAALRMFWEVRTRWREWPVSALIAFGGVILTGAVVAVHMAWIRLWGAPFGWSWLGPNGYLTWVRTLIFMIVWLAIGIRTARSVILNDADQAAIKARSG